MMPAKIKGATNKFVSPKSWNEAELGPCLDLHVRRTDDLYESAWRPSPEEIQAIVNGACIVIGIHGMQPPIQISVEDAT